METTTIPSVPSISPGELPVLSRETLAGLHFGEGCLIEEYLFLRSLALLLQPARILEIGTSGGVGGLMLLDGASAFGRQSELTTIDIRRDDAFDANAALFLHLQNRITRIIASSDRALPELARQGRRFNLVFLDGDHSAEQVARDWENVQPLCDQFVLHDTDQMPGCRALVERIRSSERYDVLPLAYPLGHQVFHNLAAEDKLYDGIYHQRQLGWNTSTRGPGMTLVQRRTRPEV